MSYRQQGVKTVKKKKRPYIVGKCAQTLDGKIATFSGSSKWITSAQTRAFARKQRDRFDAILVGINTVRKDDPTLKGTSKKKVLKKIVLDRRLKISLKAKLFKGMPPSSCIIATTRHASKAKIKRFREAGIVIILCPQKKGRINLRWLMGTLAQNGVHSILLEGGATVLGQALNDGIVDEMNVYMAPKILGDQSALSSVVGRKIKLIKQTIDLSFKNIKRVGKDIYVQAYVLGNR